MITATSLLVTGIFLREQARRIAADAREIKGIDDAPVRAAVRVLYDLSKAQMDARAREIAANAPPEPTPSRKTNVGDPNPKGW